ncbi:hypothetical protein ACU6ZI_24215 [Klebsiella aerogenes]
MLITLNWVYHVLSDSEWSGRRQIQPSASVNSICLLKSALDIGFNDDGTQVMPVPARIGGRAEGLNALLKAVAGRPSATTTTGN